MSSNTGISPIAIQSSKMWEGNKRPRGWRRGVFGLLVHTTGAGLPAKAKYKNKAVHEAAEEHYLKSHGTHYVAAYDGTLIQVANEDMQANGAGVLRQVESVRGGNWVSESLPNVEAFSKWVGRWVRPGVATPLDIFPSKSANSCYVHVEMPPCVFWWDGRLHTEATPMREGLRFTKAQHDAVVALAIDLSDRNSWPAEWWITGRLAGHEDVSPITRHTSAGCWDPGALRPDPWFDWKYVKDEVIAVYVQRERDKAQLDAAQEEVRVDKNGAVPFENVINAFVSWVSGFFVRKDK